VTCYEVRERLTEQSLGVLSRTDAREVERHLEWCPGCRREAGELAEGATAVALSLPPAEPPSSLEGRIVERFRMASGRAPLPRRGRVWVLIAAVLAASIAMSGTTGWVIAKQGTETLQEKVERAQRQTADLSGLISDLNKNGHTLTATLEPPDGGLGFGNAVIFSAPQIDDFVFVDIPVLPQTKGTYVLQLVDGRQAINAGQLSSAAGDRLVLLRWFPEVNLGGVVTVTVIDSETGDVVLTGTVQPYVSP
jgi:Putative zinc-finger